MASSNAKLVMRKAVASVIMMRISRVVVNSSGSIMEAEPVNLNPGNIKKCESFVGESKPTVKPEFRFLQQKARVPLSDGFFESEPLAASRQQVIQ